MTKQLKEIGTRLRCLREDCEMEASEVAEKVGVTLEEYNLYEAGERDFSFSFLYNVAELLGVDVVDIMSGESPQLSGCCVVRNGKGYAINRYNYYDYRHLAFTFRNKKAEPFLVKLDPKDSMVMNSHEGQEFNYVLKGKMKFYFDDIIYELEEGDSVYFDSSHPHAEVAMGEERAEFISVVIK